MRYRTFGTSGLRVSELFLGAMTFGEQGGVGAPPEESRRLRSEPGKRDTSATWRGLAWLALPRCCCPVGHLGPALEHQRLNHL